MDLLEQVLPLLLGELLAVVHPQLLQVRVPGEQDAEAGVGAGDVATRGWGGAGCRVQGAGHLSTGQ